MRIPLPTPDRAHAQRRAELKNLIAEFERKNGKIKTSDIVRRTIDNSQFNGKNTRKARKEGNTQERINQQIRDHYATAHCLNSLADELGITVNSLYKRAQNMHLRRRKAA